LGKQGGNVKGGEGEAGEELRGKQTNKQTTARGGGGRGIRDNNGGEGISRDE
jgi:hypothetical protein